MKGDIAMQFKLYTDMHEFYNDTYDVLMRHEAQNMVPLGNIIIEIGRASCRERV